MIDIKKANGKNKMVRHEKSGRLYTLLNDKCKAKINGEWVEAVCYYGKDKYTDELTWFIREQSDFNSNFTLVEDNRKTTSLSFGEAIQLLKVGYPLRRSGWNGKGMFICKQIPAHIESDIIPKMQSLPQAVKERILKGNGFIDYTDQCLIYNENTGRADSWNPSVADIFATDWEILA